MSELITSAEAISEIIDKINIMKSYRRKAILIVSLVNIIIGFAYSQTSEISTEMPDSVASQKLAGSNNAVLYHWDTPDLQPIDIESVRQQKKDNESYLADLELLEAKLKSNRDELKVLMNQAKVENKKLDSEMKMSSQKNKFIKEDSKLQKEEKKLREKEWNSLKNEKNEFKKNSAEFDSKQKEIRYDQFNERENKILDADANWKKKWDVLRNNQNSQMQVDTKLGDREREIKRRIKELDQQNEALDIKEKQLNVEKKQIKLEMKKSKAFIQ